MNRLQMLRKAGGGLNNRHWWLAPGMSYTDVIAAYQFKGVSSEDAALINKNRDKSYRLEKTGSHVWSADIGYSMSGSGGFNNADLNALEIQSIAMCVADLSGPNDTVKWLARPNADFKLTSGYSYTYFSNGAYHDGDSGNYVATFYRTTSGTLDNPGSVGGRRSTTSIGSGVHTITVSGRGGDQCFCIDGTYETSRRFGHACESSSLTNSIQTICAGHTYKLIAAAFYSVILTEENHKAINAMMLTI